MLIKALLIAIWAGICALDQMGFHLGFRKPLLAGVVVGVILGDPVQGLILAGTLELMWLGTNAIGAYQPPDVISGAIVGVAIAILSGKGEAAGIAIAIPVSLLVQQLIMFVTTFNISLVHKAKQYIEKGEFNKIDYLHYLGGLNYFLSRAIPVFVAVYFGATAIESLLAVVPAWVLGGLSVASKIIPVVGLAMLLSMMMKKNMWMFLLLGFSFATFMKLSLVAMTFIAVFIAGIYDLIMNQGSANEISKDATEKEVYDL